MIYYNKDTKSIVAPAAISALGYTLILQGVATKAVTSYEVGIISETAVRRVLGVDLSALPAGEYAAYIIGGTGWTLGEAKSNPLAMEVKGESGEACLLADLCPQVALLKIEGDSPAHPSAGGKPEYYYNNNA